MSEPTIQGMSVGCPYCPTRATCACPDGPERCPDNAECPCDKTVCPCGKHAKRPPVPPHEPPGCRDRSLWLGLGLLVLVVIVLGAFGLRSCGDDDDDGLLVTDTGASTVASDVAPPPDTVTTPTDAPPPTDAAPPPATDPPATEPPATDPPAATTTTPPATTTEPPAPTFVPPSVDPSVINDINTAVFGGQVAFGPGNCHVVTGAMQQIDQTGASPLVDPALDVNAICSANANFTQLPMLDGDFFVLTSVHGAPLSPATNIAFQPGIGLDRPDVPNAPPADSGEGLIQVGVDVLGFGGSLDGWQQAQFFSVPGFGATDVFGYVFAEDGSPYTGFAVPAAFVPPGTIAYGQSFGRQTLPGEQATAGDPAASNLFIVGPVPPCFGDCSPEPGRFTVDVLDGSDTLNGVEGDGGTFWFFDPDNAEILVKVLDGCSPGGFNDHYWVFAGSLTAVEIELTVTDTASDLSRAYENTPGAFEPILDTEAFATCP